MQIHKLRQGSAEWHQFRLDHFGASEAAAMLGLSTKMKRNELLHMKHTMQPKEFSDWVENVLFAGGHEAEELARPITENEIGEDLFPVTCSDGDLSASCDGFTLCYKVAWEHKQWNVYLADSVRDCAIPVEHMAQCQQILMITKASELIFTCSDGTVEKRESMSVTLDPVWVKRITDGWAQFKKDLAEYVPRELTEKPQASAIMQLPALAIQIKGEVIASNLPAFKAAAEDFISKINTELKTDEDFSNAEATVKYCDETEKKLEAAKKAAIAQTASIEEVMNTIDFIKDQLRTKRLDLYSKVKTEKERIKRLIRNKAEGAFVDHIQELEKEIDPVRLKYEPINIAFAMKGKRTLESLHNAADTELARCKILANEAALNVRNKLIWLRGSTEGEELLLPDLQTIIYKDMGDLQLIVGTRIADQKKAIEEATKKKVEAAKVEAEKLKQKAIDDDVVEPVKKVSSFVGHAPSNQGSNSGIKIILAPEEPNHRMSIRGDAILSMVKNGVDNVSADYIIKLIGDGKIDHVTIKY